MKFWRSSLIFLFIVAISATVTGRLIYVQIMNFEFWRAFAQGQQNIFENYFGERGEIFFSGDSLPVATNRDSYFVYLSVPEVEETEETLKFLSETLSLDEEFILGKLDNKENLFAVLKYELTDPEIENIEKQDLPGVHIEKKRERYYPQGEMASHVFGFVGADGDGQYGLEDYYDDVLKGEEEFIMGERGPNGTFLFFPDEESGIKGADLYLTIDYNMQFMAEKLLESAKNTLGIESGQIIVMEPDTGKILALADYPNFDPNNYSEYVAQGGMEIFQNSVTQKIFEPGSAFKPITMAIGLENKTVTPQTTYIDEGIRKFGGYTIYNYDGRKYGETTMTQVLEKSINTGAVFVEESLSHDVFLDYLEKFGFFEKSGIDLAETYSENNELRNGREVNFATASFGQGIEMNPIQLVRAFCALANGGKLVRPYLV
ncbi:MAG: penicillin-binding protein 2, partial [Patescibacteria group bacterium]